ncbi:MAG: hypothetical protein COA78_01285 [Blastopirellula sp.]|nr:MAG: hypothetical protein COA78_01285 [Blastopirellula sp.]
MNEATASSHYYESNRPMSNSISTLGAIAAIFFLSVLVYGGSYLATVEKKYDEEAENLLAATYSVDDQWSPVIFAPANKIDRAIRTDYWANPLVPRGC